MAEETGALATPLEQAVKKVVQLRKEREAAMRKLEKLREGKERVAYERDELQEKLQLAQHEWRKCVDAVNSAQRGVGKRQEFVAKDAFALQKRVEDHRVRMC